MENGVDKARANALVRTRIEPKTFFANERTFLSWLTIAIMVMFMGLSLLDGASLGGLPGPGTGSGSSNLSDHCRHPDGTVKASCNGAKVCDVRWEVLKSMGAHIKQCSFQIHVCRDNVWKLIKVPKHQAVDS